jgi:hypothetical protein
MEKNDGVSALLKKVVHLIESGISEHAERHAERTGYIVVLITESGDPGFASNMERDSARAVLASLMLSLGEEGTKVHQ